MYWWHPARQGAEAQVPVDEIMDPIAMDAAIHDYCPVIRSIVDRKQGRKVRCNILHEIVLNYYCRHRYTFQRLPVVIFRLCVVCRSELSVLIRVCISVLQIKKIFLCRSVKYTLISHLTWVDLQQSLCSNYLTKPAGWYHRASRHCGFTVPLPEIGIITHTEKLGTS